MKGAKLLFNEIQACRICGCQSLPTVLDLGNQALATKFPEVGEPDPETAPLVLVKCSDCGLVQLKHSVLTSELYTHTYGYRSGINQSMRSHLSGITDCVAKTVSLNAGDIVVDIGCNDGTLLKSYDQAGLVRIGIDPIADHFRKYYTDDLKITEDYFSISAFESLADGKKAKVITSISMFYDLEDPVAFAADIKGSLASDGVWILEQSYLPTMLERNSYDTLCHEHLEYYGLAQIQWIADKVGLAVFHCELNDCNGGSFRVFVGHSDGPHNRQSETLKELLDKEAAVELATAEPYLRFAEHTRKVRDELKAFVAEERGRGKTFAVYGASTKGNTLLQYCGFTQDDFFAAADRNPEKWGRRTPISHIPILSEEDVRAQNPDYFLVLPWHFRTEFLEREKTFRANGGRLIFPLPTLEII